MASAAARVALVRRGVYMRGRTISKLLLLRKHLMASRGVLLAGLCCLGAKSFAAKTTIHSISSGTLRRKHKFRRDRRA